MIFLFKTCRIVTWLGLLLFAAIGGYGCSSSPTGEAIRVFAGSASQPAINEISRMYEKERGVRVDLNFGSSGMVLSQMKLTRRGDVYIPGSGDYMEKAKRDKIVDPATVRIAAYLVPAINVKPGNPRGIQTLADLAQPGLRIGIAKPEQVCVGLYAVEIMESAGLLESIKPNIVVTTESCAKTAGAIATGNLDAVIGWRVFKFWNPKRIESVLLPSEHVVRIGYIPMAVSNFTDTRDTALDFVSYATGPKGRAVFEKYGYITDEKKVRQLAPRARIGGEYILPEIWRRVAKL